MKPWYIIVLTLWVLGYCVTPVLAATEATIAERAKEVVETPAWPNSMRPLADNCSGIKTFTFDRNFAFGLQSNGVPKGKIPLDYALPLIELGLKTLHEDFQKCIVCHVGSNSIDRNSEGKDNETKVAELCGTTPPAASMTSKSSWNELTAAEKNTVQQWFRENATQYNLDPKETDMNIVFKTYKSRINADIASVGKTKTMIQEAKAIVAIQKQALTAFCPAIQQNLWTKGIAQKTEVETVRRACDNQRYMYEQLLRVLMTEQYRRFTYEQRYASLQNGYQSIYNALDLVHQKLSGLIALLKKWQNEQNVLTK